jgi:hypothetical protein
MRSLRSSLVALVLCLGASIATAQTATPQTAALCVQKPFQGTTHLDVTIPNTGFTHGTFSIQLPGTAAKIQQISVKLAAAPTGVSILRNLDVTIRLNNVRIEHGIDVPNNPFLQADTVFAATLSRQVTFYADAGSVAVFDADFAGIHDDTRGVDISIVGLTRSDGCSGVQ